MFGRGPITGTTASGVYAEATIRYTFKIDNQFELYQNIVLHDHTMLPTADGAVEVPAEGDPVVDRDLVVLGSGTYWTVADSLFLDVTEVEETLNRDSLVAILTHLGKWMALHICDMTGGCPEDYAAYQEAVVAKVIRDFRHAFYFEGDSGPVNTYRIEHGKLWIIETWGRRHRRNDGLLPDGSAYSRHILCLGSAQEEIRVEGPLRSPSS